jgi:hypothetical protein
MLIGLRQNAKHATERAVSPRVIGTHKGERVDSMCYQREIGRECRSGEQGQMCLTDHNQENYARWLRAIVQKVERGFQKNQQRWRRIKMCLGIERWAI